MTTEVRVPTAAPGRSRTTLAIVLLGAAAGAVLLRCAAIAEPLGIDQSLWASAVRGMSRGQLLYQDVWEQRPPGIYFIYLAGFQLLGWSAATVAWLDVLAAAALTMLLFWMAQRLGDTVTGAAAAALFATLTMPAGLYGHGGFLERSVCETFIALAVALGAACALHFRDRPSLAAAFGVGLFGGAAVILKPNAGLYFPALLLWMFLFPAHASTTRRPFIRPLAVACLGGAVLPLLTLAWLWRLGIMEEERVAVVEFNRYYVAEGFSPTSYAVDFSKAVWLRIKTNALWFSGVAAAIVAVWELARTRRLQPLAGLAVLWGGAATLVIIVNGARLFNSYFIQALPPLALLAAWFLAQASRTSTAYRRMAVATGVLMILPILNGHYPSKVAAWTSADVNALRGAEPRERYLERFGGYGNGRGYSARANEELAAYVRQHTRPEERVFLFGINGAGLYFAADRLTAHRFLRVNFFVETDFPDRRFRLDAVLADLARSRPRYLIFERLHGRSAMAAAADALPTHPAVAELLRGYALETRIEDFTLYRRAD